MSLKKSLLLLSALMIISVPALAVEEPSKVPPLDKEKLERLGKTNPYIPKRETKAHEIASKIDEPALKHLYVLREGFGNLRAVTMVQRDVGTAVTACGKVNPEMKESMDQRFAKWNSTVDPVVREKENLIDDAIKTQTYVKPKEIKDYLKLIEQSAQHANRMEDKQIVTTPEACQGLLDSMDRTEETVAKVLSQITVLPWPPAPEPAPVPVTTPN